MAFHRNTPYVVRCLALGTVLAALAGCCGPDDAACSQQQTDALGMILLGGAASYRPYQTPAPAFVSCTRSGRMVNCIGQ